MCGIFGILLLNPENVYKLIINGLTQLQNRGYDSAGLCVVKDDNFNILKYASTNETCAINLLLKNTDELKDDKLSIGIGHNRWATHGMKTDENAHPHESNNKNFVIVHNGIIENYINLKTKLINEGFTFVSQTDTEIIANLIEYNYNKCENVFESIKKTISDLSGTYGLIILNRYEPDKLYCVRNGSPLLIGQNEDRIIITSEQSGFCNMVNNYISLNNNDICIIEKSENEKLKITSTCIYLEKKLNILESNLTPAPYCHWTLKEINEQPNVILNSINNGGRIKNDFEVKLGGLEEKSEILKTINNIIILGCGTSFFAGLYGTYYFKQLCNFNTVQAFDGADFNDNDIPKIGNTAFILISQSGETLDLLRCVEIANNNNITTIGVINVVDSLIASQVDCGVYCNAGKEVGVASTKAFTSQVVCLSMISIWFSSLHNINQNTRYNMIKDLRNLSNDIKNTLDNCSMKIVKVANNYSSNSMFLLGKGADEFIAKEGALKIKEISYIHAEGYSSSSLKHGPFALLNKNFPVIILNLDKKHKAKILNCYNEVVSRESSILLISNDNSIIDEVSCETILVSENKTYASLLGIIPIQLLAYHLSINNGINPDKPKNLAKVVTVE